MKLFLAFSFCCIQLLCYGQWLQVGPYGGPDHPLINGTNLCFASKGKTLLIGTLSGLYVSNDNGKAWDQVEALPMRQVKDIKTNAGRILIYYEDSGFYVSDNAGISWEPTSALLQQGEIEQVSFYNKEVYVTYRRKQVFSSTDNGKNWKMIFAGDADTLNYQRSVLCVNRRGSDIFIGGSEKLLVSKDEGQTWRSVYANLPVFPKNTKGSSYFEIEDIFFLDSVIYVKDYYQTYYSSDQGKKWTLLKDMGFYNNSRYTNMIIYQHRLIGASVKGILEFDPSGNTWKPYIEVKDKILFNDSAWLGWPGKSLFSSGPNLFIRHADKLFVSNSGGRLWTRVPLELDKYEDNRTHFILTDHDYILFKTYKDLLLSADNGLSIQSINFGWKHSDISAIWTKDSIVIAGGIQNKTFISRNHGLHWDALITGSESGSGCKAEFVAIHKDIYFVNACGQLYCSVTGENNTRTYKRVMKHIGVYTMKDSLIYAGVNTSLSGEGDRTYVAVSADNGAHWNKVYNNVSTDKIDAIITSGKNIIIGTDKGIYIASGDPKTAKWKNTYNYKYGIETFTRLDSCIIAGTANKGVLISVDDGLTWKTWNHGLPTDTPSYPNAITRINALTTYGHHIFAATAHGIYVLKYGDNSWTNITGNANDRIRALAADNLYLYIGTENNGVMRRPLSELPVVE